MINRVFCYSEQVAKRNGNDFSFGKQCACSLVIMIAVMFTFLLFCMLGSATLALLLSFVVFGIGMVWLVIGPGAKIRAKLMGFTTDTDGNVYRITLLDNGSEFLIGGLAGKGVIDTVLQNNNSIAGNVASGAGAILSMNAMKRKNEMMKNPDLVARMSESARSSLSVEAIQILKVYHWTQDSHKVKIRCDNRNVRTGKISYNEEICIHKAYNCFDDLMNIILNPGRRIQ